MNWNTLITIITIIFLAINSIYDLRNQEILLLPTLLYGIFGFLLPLIGADRSYPQIFLGLLPGIFLLMLGKLTEEKIGYGDGILILTLGIWCGPISCLMTLTFGLLLASIWSGIALLRKKAHKNMRIPFLPFLFIAYLIRSFL